MVHVESISNALWGELRERPIAWPLFSELVRGNKVALISVTRLRVRSFGYLPRFVRETLKATRQVEHSPSFLGGKLLRNAKNAFWTLTAWTDEAAMNAYRTGGAHRSVMPKLLNLVRRGRCGALDSGIARTPFLASGP